MSLAAGEVFAGYTVVRLLGSGGTGEVYLAKHPRSLRQDALRVLPASVSAHDGFRARFDREAELAAALWHPHVVGVNGRGEDQGRLWLASEFVDGSSAENLVRERHPDGLPAEEVIDIVTAIADALDYAHGQGLRHHGVTPANILLTAAPGPRILLTDFGIPRRANLPAGRDDQLELATTAYRLLSGATPFAKMLTPTRPDLVAIYPVLVRASATDPSARFDTCQDFARALRDGLGGTTNTVASPIAHMDGPATGPKQPVFVPAWSEEPAPNPYLDPEPDPYADVPYPDVLQPLGPPSAPDAVTMTKLPASPPQAPLRDRPSAGPTSRTWAVVAGVAAVVALGIVLVVVGTRGGSDTRAEPSIRPPISDGPAPQASPPPSAGPAPSTPDGTPGQRTTPSQIPGPDGVGESCGDGYQITGREGWATHARRGNAAATCTFAGNVLQAYWEAADPSNAPRTVVVAGGIPCSEGAQCAGDKFVVTCAVEGSDPWITCRGGRDAVVYLY